MCGNPGNWWLAVFVNLNSSSKIWLMNSMVAGFATRSHRAKFLWNMLGNHWLVHNKHLTWPKPKTIAHRAFSNVCHEDRWSCALYACCHAELEVLQVLAGQEMFLLNLSLDLSSQDKRRILIS